MEFRDEILHRRELDEMGWAYLAEYLGIGLVFSEQLAEVITNKRGRLISWLPDNVKIPEPSYFEYSLTSSRPPKTSPYWGGTREAHALLLKNILTVQANSYALFEA